LEKNLEEKTAHWHRLKSEFEALRQEESFNLINLTQALKRLEMLKGEMGRSDGEKKRQLEEEAFLNDEISALSQENHTAQSRTETLQERFRTLKSSVETLEAQTQQILTKLHDSNRTLASLSETMAGAESLLEHHHARLMALKAQNAAASENFLNQGQNLEKLNCQMQVLGQTQGKLEAEAVGLRETLASDKTESARIADQINTARTRLAAMGAKLETLSSLKNSFAWYPQGLKALMDAPHDIRQNLMGPLAEFVKIPAGYEEAAENILGERLGWLVVKNHKAAALALEYLNEHKLGRCAFICLDEPRLTQDDLTVNFLGHFKLANTLSEAFAQPPLDGPQNCPPAFLTLSGEYWGGRVLAGGQMAVGGQENENNAGILARLKEVEELKFGHQRALGELSRLQNKAVAASEKLAVSEKNLSMALEQSAKLQKTIVDLEKSIMAATLQQTQAQTEQRALETETKQTETKIISLNQALRADRLQKQQLNESTQNLEQQISTLSQSLAEQNEVLDEARNDSEDARLNLASIAARKMRAQGDLAKITRWLEESEASFSARQDELDSLNHDISVANETNGTLKIRLNDFPPLIQTAADEVNCSRNSLNDNRTQQNFWENEAKEARRLREELHSTLNNQETELMSVAFNLEKIEDDLLRNWQVLMPPPENLENPQAEILAEQQPNGEDEFYKNPQIDILNTGEWAKTPLNEDAPQHLETLRRKFAALGDVSLGAISKKDELQAEYERYQLQYDDLSTAIDDLKTSISRINHTCRLRFSETFKDVNEKFREIFPILFEGGEGWLSLTNEDDPLESGVEIHVHPPGKKVLVMSLLSGGEKALTALALIFALYLIKPSPFCLLDETDAPLDDANIDRFNRLLSRLSRTSQIIMVT
ncbi:MAG: hypothetical protein ACRCTY_06695, partial [Candidatus Adiutrix sp.]